MLSQSCFVDSLIIVPFLAVVIDQNTGLAFRLSLSFRCTTQLLIKAEKKFGWVFTVTAARKVVLGEH